MKTKLNKKKIKKIKKIIKLLGVDIPQYKEINLTKSEIESLYKLSQENNKENNFIIKTSNESGIGSTVKVIINNKEIDITDVDSW